MQPGYVNQTGKFDAEILRSSDFQLISITLDSTAVYDPAGDSSDYTEIPKGTLLTLSSAIDQDGTYTVLSTENGKLNGTATQYMKDVVVLAETIVDASLGDQPVKAYLAGTFDLGKLTYTNIGTAITMTQWATCNRLQVVDIADVA